jgi:hypothetical protein
MSKLWQHYVFRRGVQVPALWDDLFTGRAVRLLYITGRGFDPRARSTMQSLVQNIASAGHKIEKATLLLVELTGYQLEQSLVELTTQNAQALQEFFAPLGNTVTITIGSSLRAEEEISASSALRLGTEQVVAHVTDHTDIILDISSLPRIAYLAFATSLLTKLVPNKSVPGALFAGGVNLQIVVAEDPVLDGHILSEDPSNDLVLIPGFSSVLYAESAKEWPMVWFPILGDNRVNQLKKLESIIPETAEVCPVLPHPARDPRRAERLLVEYKAPLFDTRQTPPSDFLYVHESQPFEAYRQLLSAMRRYQASMSILGGCRLVVTPLASKLITLGAGLACFEMHAPNLEGNSGVAIAHAEPTRYVVSLHDLHASKPEVSSLLVTGQAYE